MRGVIKIKKGYDILLQGVAEKIYESTEYPDSFAIKPTDFYGVFPKLLVKQGDEVKAGEPLFYDKFNPKVKFTAPVSGEIIEIKRGERRKILEIRILPDKEIKYKEFKCNKNIEQYSKEEIKKLLLESGLWPFIKQRPFDIIANPDDTPRDIFISAFDTNPLAPDYDFIVHGNGEHFQKGLDVIAKLTDGKVYLSVRGDINQSKVFLNSKGVEILKFIGPHPTGNVGVQIHNYKPINKGEIVWTLKPQDILMIGRFFDSGILNTKKLIAVCGSEVLKPRYYQVYLGTSLSKILQNNITEGNNRIISGNVLTGTKVDKNGYLGFYDDQITVIPEGDKPEFMGWLFPSYPRPSNSLTFCSTWLDKLGRKKRYKVNTNTHGEERAFVMSGEYEKVFPFDIYPVHLLKAILVEDIEMMENLGIYEVIPEDFAICEFVCTSKINSQEIIRKGLDLIRKEMF